MSILEFLVVLRLFVAPFHYSPEYNSWSAEYHIGDLITCENAYGVSVVWWLVMYLF